MQYLAVCVSFVSPYLFITPIPKFYPFGLRKRGDLHSRIMVFKFLFSQEMMGSSREQNVQQTGFSCVSVIRVPCHRVALNRCMRSTGYVITWRSTQRHLSQSKKCMMNTSELQITKTNKLVQITGIKQFCLGFLSLPGAIVTISATIHWVLQTLGR